MFRCIKDFLLSAFQMTKDDGADGATNAASFLSSVLTARVIVTGTFWVPACISPAEHKKYYCVMYSIQVSHLEIVMIVILGQV